MYIPEHFHETRAEVLHGFIRAHPFATLISQGSEGMVASHVPLLLDAEANILSGHLARGNPQSKEPVEVLVIFHGAHHYISPSWYPSKAEHGKVVPTWNYAAVHVYGRMRLIEDPQRLLEHLRKLTAAHDETWSVSDAPADFIEGMMRGVAGVEIAITRIEGKWKVSQNRARADRVAVAARLRELGADEMAAMVEAAMA